jgi:hypothetical protein
LNKRVEASALCKIKLPLIAQLLIADCERVFDLLIEVDEVGIDVVYESPSRREAKSQSHAAREWLNKAFAAVGRK